MGIYPPWFSVLWPLGKTTYYLSCQLPNSIEQGWAILLWPRANINIWWLGESCKSEGPHHTSDDTDTMPILGFILCFICLSLQNNGKSVVIFQQTCLEGFWGPPFTCIKQEQITIKFCQWNTIFWSVFEWNYRVLQISLSHMLTHFVDTGLPYRWILVASIIFLLSQPRKVTWQTVRPKAALDLIYNFPKR